MELKPLIVAPGFSWIKVPCKKKALVFTLRPPPEYVEAGAGNAGGGMPALPLAGIGVEWLDLDLDSGDLDTQTAAARPIATRHATRFHRPSFMFRTILPLLERAMERQAPSHSTDQHSARSLHVRTKCLELTFAAAESSP